MLKYRQRKEMKESEETVMKFQQIRSATINITYAGRTFLIDPWLAPRFTSGCLAMIPMMCAMNRGGDPRKKYGKP